MGVHNKAIFIKFTMKHTAYEPHATIDMNAIIC